MKFGEIHTYFGQVEFEDVDAGMAVHHPRYLLFLERARCAGMKDAGSPFSKMLAERYAFVVAQAHMSFKKSLKMDDRFAVLSLLCAAKRSSIKVKQAVLPTHVLADLNLERAGHDLTEWNNLTGYCYFSCVMRLVCVNLETAKPVEILPDQKKLLNFPTPDEISRNPSWELTSLADEMP